MKKLAICIPSYNEGENIENITKLVDESLNKLEKYEFVIVNCDNDSPDFTNQLFMNTYTEHEKKSILTQKKGKGINIYNFFQYCLENNIDYAITIDADLKSFQNDWILNMILKLEEGYNFVFPCYQRKIEEGNTTNHFVVPVLYAIYGKFIRQPIGGDYAFDSYFIKEIMKEQFTDNILKYGIDIFLVVSAIVKNMKTTTINLGKKVHGSSYLKMVDIFESVVRGFLEVYQHYPIFLEQQVIQYEPIIDAIKKSEFRDELEEKYLHNLKMCQFEKNDYQIIEQNWLYVLKEYIEKLPNIDEELINKMKKIFVCRTISFWDEMNQLFEKGWEKNIVENAIWLGENTK